MTDRYRAVANRRRSTSTGNSRRSPCRARGSGRGKNGREEETTGISDVAAAAIPRDDGAAVACREAGTIDRARRQNARGRRDDDDRRDRVYVYL